MTQIFPVELSDDDAALVDAHGIDLDEVVARALETERQHRTPEPPDPKIPDTVERYLRALHQRVTTDATTGIGSFQQDGADPRVSISACTLDDDYRVRVTVSELGTLSTTTAEQTLSDSGAFLATIGRRLRERLADLNDTHPSTYSFERIKHETPTHDLGVETAVFETHVEVDSDGIQTPA